MLEKTTLTHSLENPDDELKRLRERVVEQTTLIEQLREHIRELWLSLARRASNSRMHSRRCSISAVCSTTRSRNRLSSPSGFSGEWVRVGYSNIRLGYVCSLLLGKRS